ncbi:MAG: hypothetical protein AAGB19_05155 [Cyanobacteria bacterium P01_F01_bin.3]
MTSGDYGRIVTGDDASSRPSAKHPSRHPTEQGTVSGHIAGSWLETFRALTGSRPHKPSFVIFDIGQSGCITLAKWFTSHKAISFQENILRQTVRFPRLSVYQRIRQSASDVYGFSLTVEQLRQVQRLADPNQFLQDLHRGGCRVIYLSRRDVLRHAIATLRTHSVSCRFDDKEPSRSNKLTVDVSELLACLKYLDNQRIEADAIMHDIPHLDLVYEEDLMDPNTYPETAQKLSDFLAIPDIKPTGSGLKLVHQKLTNIVENYKEVLEGVENSDYAYLLTDSRHLLTTM